MDATQIARLGSKLNRFLAQFQDCFSRSEPRQHLRTYVQGQLSDLPRKSAEPIALAAGTPPRTLQRFLESIRWDEQRLRDRQQRIVARDHAHANAIGILDESGNPKKGRHTAAVQHQWCGNSGKVDTFVKKTPDPFADPFADPLPILCRSLPIHYLAEFEYRANRRWGEQGLFDRLVLATVSAKP